MGKIPLYIIQIFWELPQNLLGLALFLIKHRDITEVKKKQNRFYLRTNIGISLGSFIFWCQSERIRKHEFGHSIQSRYLGPLYLIIIGLPSISRAGYAALYYRLKRKHWQNYFEGFPENQADRLGGV